MSYSFDIIECPKCEKYKVVKNMLVNKITKEMICLDCAIELEPEEVQELINQIIKGEIGE